MGDALPASTSARAAPPSRSAPATTTRARSSTTAPSSAGATTATASSVWATPVIAATSPARWATRSPPSTSAPAAPPSRSPPAVIHTCALLDNGTVKCWGANGVRPARARATPRTAATNPGEMGDALPAVDLGTGRTATAITPAIVHTCALLDDATVKCWGYNGNGAARAGRRQFARRRPGEMGDALPAIDLGTGRTATAVLGGRFALVRAARRRDAEVLGPELRRPARPGRHRVARRQPRRDGRRASGGRPRRRDRLRAGVRRRRRGRRARARGRATSPPSTATPPTSSTTPVTSAAARPRAAVARWRPA